MRAAITLFAIAGVLVPAAAGADTVFTPQRFLGAALHGDGGESTAVHGIEVWTAGLPARSFRVIGTVRDTRDDGPFDGTAARSARLARLVREHGGDAAVLRSTTSQVAGKLPDGAGGVFWGTRNYSAQRSAAKRTVTSGFAVIRYLD